MNLRPLRKLQTLPESVFQFIAKENVFHLHPEWGTGSVLLAPEDVTCNTNEDNLREIRVWL